MNSGCQPKHEGPLSRLRNGGAKSQTASLRCPEQQTGIWVHPESVGFLSTALLMPNGTGSGGKNIRLEKDRVIVVHCGTASGMSAGTFRRKAVQRTVQSPNFISVALPSARTPTGGFREVMSKDVLMKTSFLVLGKTGSTRNVDLICPFAP